jgi:hypothetical protein
MRTPRGLSGALKSLHRVASTSDVLSSPAGTPESVSVPPDVLSVITLLADGEADFTCESKDFCFVRPVRAGRASARERLSSYREPARDEPAGRAQEDLLGILNARTVSPSVHPRPASGGATAFFLASALRHRPTLRSAGVKDARCVQPMSATQTNCVHPHLARSRLALAAFAARTPHGD